jgi:endonuclease/exonuclease/phosphatase family metal-dependent hydrolase
MAEVLADELGYHGVSSLPIGRGDVGFTNAVLSRWNCVALGDEALPRADGSPGHRRIVAASVQSPWGPWPVASTHFDHRFDDSATRVAQATRVLELVARWRGDPTIDLPVILGADVNAVADADEVRVLTGRRNGVHGVVMSDAWEQVGTGDGWTWRRDNPNSADSAWPNRRLDYVMVSWPRPKPTGNPMAAHLAGLDPVDVGGTAVWPSDHAAVVVDLTTPR